MSRWFVLVMLFIFNHLHADSDIQNPDWPRYNHDNSNTSSNRREFRIGRNNVADLEVAWKSPQITPYDSVDMTALVADGVAYIYDFYGILVARSVDDGSTLWQITLTSPSGQPITTQGATPLLSDGVLYVVDDQLDLFAIRTQDGHIIWRTVMDPVNAATGQSNAFASVTRVGDILVIPVTSADEELPIEITIRPTINAFDAQTGLRLWSYIINPTGSTGVGAWSTPAFDEELGLMYIGTTNAENPPAGPYTDALLAMDYRTGELRWVQQYTAHDVWSGSYPNGLPPGKNPYRIDRDLGASPNLFLGKNNKKLVGAMSKAGVYRAFDRKTGRPVWKHVVTKFPAVTGNPGAAYDGEKLYVAASVDVGPLLTPELVAKSATNFNAFIKVTRLIWTKLTSVVVALDPATGKKIWSHDFPHLTWTTPTEANGVLYMQAIDGTLSFLNTDDGSVLGSLMTPKYPKPLFGIIKNLSLTQPLSIVDGKVYVSTSFGFSKFGPAMIVYTVPNPNID